MNDTEQQVFTICRAAMNPKDVIKQVHDYNQNAAKVNKFRKRNKQPLQQFMSKDKALETYGTLDMEIVMKWAALKGIDPIGYAKQWVALTDEQKMAVFQIVSADEVEIVDDPIEGLVVDRK
jgi:PleD family two-component response regulator